jgi:hypothetical protein
VRAKKMPRVEKYPFSGRPAIEHVNHKKAFFLSPEKKVFRIL